jgi:hypothetical protein
MEEDEGNGVLVEDASASQQEGQGVPQGPEPLFNPPAPEEVQEAEDFVPPPQPGDTRLVVSLAKTDNVPFSNYCIC